MYRGLVGVLALLAMMSLSTLGTATDAELYFSFDKAGEQRVTTIREGQSVFLVIDDPDENIDCDIRDKFWTVVHLMDPKTGADIDWESWQEYDVGWPDYVGRDGCAEAGHYFEETGADTGLFVSNVSFQIGRRIDWDVEQANTHWVGFDFDGYGLDGWMFNDLFGDFFYWGDWRTVYDLLIDPEYAPFEGLPFGPFQGWFENMDTLVGLVQDPSDASDVAIAMMKIIDVEATISWDRAVYDDANEAAAVTVIDSDENLDRSRIEFVPVFVLLNPGSWNPMSVDGPTTFWSLWAVGGVVDLAGNTGSAGIWAWNIYDSGLHQIDLGGDGSNQPNEDGTWYIDYPTAADDNVVAFDTASNSGVTRVMFYAQETGVDTGVFQLNLNSLLLDLGFDSLRSGDVLAAYYLDPNDFDDFKVAAAAIEETRASAVRFTDAAGLDRSTYWIGHDPIYVEVVDSNANVDSCCPEQVIVHLSDPHGEDDSEWMVLDETGSNSPVFVSNAGMELAPVWDALGVGEAWAFGGYQLILDNWRFEAFNEDDVLARYNDVVYESDDLVWLGDSDDWTAFPPWIAKVRVAADVSFDMMSIGDTQVFDGEAANLFFLDRHGNRMSEYASSDCVFIEVIDRDQDEDPTRRERVDGYWADGENAWPFAPEAASGWDCGPEAALGMHYVDDRLGTVSIFNSSCGPKVYLLNPRNGYWAAADLLETGIGTGDFVSVSCVDLTSVYECEPTLGALAGDTILAVYQDPSNHSDSAWISIKVGGGGSAASQASATQFVDAVGNDVSSYTDADLVYVKITDPSHAGSLTLEDALEVAGQVFSLVSADGNSGSFITEGLNLALLPGDTLTATYTDPTDSTDMSSDTIAIAASALVVESFYASPNPFDGVCRFAYRGSGVASLMTIAIYDLAGHRIWAAEQADATEIVWNGTNARGAAVANGGYVYVISATDGAETFQGKGTVFLRR